MTEIVDPQPLSASVLALDPAVDGSDATALVMLHGWGQSSSQLRPLGEKIAEVRTVHLIDLPGFGGSPPPPGGDWTTRQYADRIVRYLDDHGLTKVDLLGHSFGGKISVQIAANYPERVRRVTLMGASGLTRKRTLAQELRIRGIRLLAKTLKQLHAVTGINWYRDWFTPRFGSRDYLASGVMRPTLVKTVNEDLTSLVSRVNAPVLLLWGDGDQETPPETGERYARLLKRARLIMMPFKGHEPFADIGFHLCAYYVRSFLKDTDVFESFVAGGTKR